MISSENLMDKGFLKGSKVTDTTAASQAVCCSQTSNCREYYYFLSSVELDDRQKALEPQH